MLRSKNKILLAVFLLSSIWTFGQAGAGQLQNGGAYQFILATTCTASACTPVATSTTFNIPTGLTWFKLSWTVDGTVSSCAVTVDGLTNSGASPNTGGIIPSQTCTSSGAVTNASQVYFNYGKFTLGTGITGSGANVTFTLTGYTKKPPAS